MPNLKTFLAFLLIILVTGSVFPQSWDMIGGPTGITPNSEIFLNDGRVLCSTAKGVFISDDSGDSWRISPSTQNYNGIYSLSQRLDGQILAVARSGILKSSDRGESWFKISDMSYLNDYGVIIYESPVDSSLYFAKSPSVYKSIDGGFNWREIWHGDVIDGFMVNDSGWIYLSARYNSIFISKDNGSTFLPLNTGIDLSNDLAYYFYPDKHGGIYFMISTSSYSIVHFSGSKLTYIENGWTDIPLGVTDDGDLIYKKNNCIALFDYSANQSYTLSCPPFVKDQFAENVVTKGNMWIANFSYLGLHRSDDAGQTWKSINNGLGFTESTAMQVTAGGKIIVSAFGGAFWGNLYYSPDDGTSWVQRNPGFDPVFYDIDTMANGNLVATGSYGIFTSGREGVSWSRRMSADYASYVFISRDSVAYAGTRPKGMAVSRNNGLTWSTADSPGSEYFSSFGESSKGRIFAAASAYTEGIYYSDDDGYNWNHINPFPYSGVYDFITKGDSVYAGTSGGIYKSDDNGLNWERISYEFIKKFESAPNGDLVGICPGKGIIKSSDNGKSWISSGEELNDRDIRDMCFDADNRLYALTDSGIFRNNDYIYPFIIRPEYGAKKLSQTIQFEWSKVASAYNYTLELYEDSLLNSRLQSITTGENTAGISALPPDRTYYWRIKANTDKFDDLYTNTGKFSTAPPFSISQNYPNPFNAGTMIEFYVPYNSRIKLKVYNILGEMIENLVDAEYPEGKYNYNWDASHLPSGIYLIQIEGDGFRQIKKAVLIK